ncbi:MFS transporter [Streptomyces spectabilis]|uniref:MFS transporter n=1 Tax=Streptomyces spectabilis TaxID=68270 RepID=UPI0033D880D2
MATALSTANAVEIPTRMSFVSELVGPRMPVKASSLSAAYFNTARMLGAALGGLLIRAVGTSAAMLLNAVSYLATLAGLSLIRTAELHRCPRRPGAGLRHIAAPPASSCRCS